MAPSDALLMSRSTTHLHAAAQAQHQVQRGLLLDVVVGQRAAVLQLLAGKDQALLVGRDALLVLQGAGVQAASGFNNNVLRLSQCCGQLADWCAESACAGSEH